MKKKTTPVSFRREDRYNFICYTITKKRLSHKLLLYCFKYRRRKDKHKLLVEEDTLLTDKYTDGIRY